MKPAKMGHRVGRTARKPFPATVEEYLASVPEPARATLNEVRSAIRSAAPPEATETISYRMPALKYKEVLVWFAAFANHCSIFPYCWCCGAFKNELKGFT